VSDAGADAPRRSNESLCAGTFFVTSKVCSFFSPRNLRAKARPRDFAIFFFLHWVQGSPLPPAAQASGLGALTPRTVVNHNRRI